MYVFIYSNVYSNRSFHFILDPYIIMLSVKQVGIKYGSIPGVPRY